MSELEQSPNPALNRPACLLFVDDEPNVLKSLKRLFTSPKHRIFLAESGAAGLEILQQQPIDLVISDMRMPQMDGAEFLTRVAENWPDTVRILLTGYADIESTIVAVNSGRIYSYCRKPWENSELTMLVDNALEQQRLREQRKQLFEVIERQNSQLKELNASLEDKVEKRTEQLKLSLQRLDRTHDALKKQYSESVKAFARIIEMRPGIKSGHSTYIAEKAKQVALQLQAGADEIKDIIYAGLLWQIGKMSLPDELLTANAWSLSSVQKARIRHHAQEGQNLLMGIEQLRNAATIIGHQYEHFDGSGFPDGLQGHEIPLGARILAVIRDYIGFLEDAANGTTMTPAQAKAYLQAKKNILYDAEVVDAFLQAMAGEETEDQRPVIEISWTQLRPGLEMAEVICNDVLYLKDQILTEKTLEDILKIRRQNKDLILRVRLGNGS